MHTARGAGLLAAQDLRNAPPGVGEGYCRGTMADFLKARKFTYETHVLVEGRWRIEIAHDPDEMRMGEDGPHFLSNHNGGVLGGISTGQDLVVRFAVKPTSSIRVPRRTLDRDFNETEIETRGRHDPCVGIRAVPVGEAMAALVLADHKLRHAGQSAF